MQNYQITFTMNKALEFVGDNSTYQKKRLFWISIMLISYSVINSYLPLTLSASQTMLFFFASGVGQLLCPMYFNIITITKSIIFTSLIAAVAINRIMFLQTMAFTALGFLGRGLYVSSFIYVNEIGGEKFRAWSFVAIFAVWGSAPFTLAVIQMLKVPDWMWILLFVSLPHTYVYAQMLKHWHYSPLYFAEEKRDFAAARQVLNLIAMENKRPQFPYRLDGQAQLQQNIGIEHKKYTHLDLILMEALKKLTIPLAILWFYRQFIYYGSFMILPLLGNEESKNLILLSVSQIVAALMSIPIKIKIKRINAFFGFACLVLLSSLLVSFFNIPAECFPKGFGCFQKFIYRSSAMIIRFSISLIGSILMNYTIEVFPTKVRNLGFGICLAASSAGSVAMPVCVQILVALNLSPFICFGLISIIAIYFIPSLPQTDGKITTKRVSEMEGSDEPILHLNFLNIL